MTADELKKFEARLMAERAHYLDALGLLEDKMNSTQKDSAGDLSAYSFHMADLGTDAMEREATGQFVSRDGQILQEINEALLRIQEGTFGVCAECGNDVHPERLESVPYAQLCASCQDRREKGRKGH